MEKLSQADPIAMKAGPQPEGSAPVLRVARLASGAGNSKQFSHKELSGMSDVGLHVKLREFRAKRRNVT